MADRTRIEWAQATWNPTPGCDRVSPGCDHCYALTLAKRLKAAGSPKYQADGHPSTSGPGFGLSTHDSALAIPLSWAKPRRVFVNSMSDLFHHGVSGEFIARVWAVMAATPKHTYQILTKRHARMCSLLTSERFRERIFLANNLDQGDILGDRWPLPNVWLGVSVENQKWADIRIPSLLDTPAALRWVSAEPLLGPIDLGIGDPHRGHDSDDVNGSPSAPICLNCSTDDGENDVEYFRREPGGGGIDWAVCGGESGPGARPMHPDWARSLRDQCGQAGVPFLFKQWGGATPKAGGRELDGRTWDQYPSSVVGV